MRNRVSIIGSILKVITYVLLLLLLLVYISPHVSSEGGGIMSVIALGAPVIFFVSFVATVFWIIYWDRVAIACVIMLLFGIGYISRLVQVPVIKKHNQTGKLLKIMTFNTHFFTTIDHVNVLDKSLDCIDTLGLGIICFQEFSTSAQNNIEKINDRLSSFPYRYMHYTKDSTSDTKYYSAIYSKYKIVNKGYIDFDRIICNSIYADVLFRNDTVRILNNHLQSNNVSRSDIDFISGKVESPSSESSIFRMFTIGKKISVNSGLRESQADSINNLIKRTPYSIVVCGDHNVIPISYTYNRVRGDLQDAFMNCGSWYGYTYKAFSNLLRIDYVFHSDKFETISYSSPNILWSDHKPVIVELKYNK